MCCSLSYYTIKLWMSLFETLRVFPVWLHETGVLWECFVVHGQRNKAHKQLFISFSIFRLLQLLKHGCKSSEYPLGRNELQFQKMPLTCYKKNVQKEHCNSNTVAVWLHPRHFKALFEDECGVSFVRWLTRKISKGAMQPFPGHFFKWQ